MYELYLYRFKMDAPALSYDPDLAISINLGGVPCLTKGKCPEKWAGFALKHEHLLVIDLNVRRNQP